MKSRSQVEKELLEWRRAQELELFASGKTMTQIAEELKVDISTVSRDIEKLRQEAISKQADYIEKELPFRRKIRAAGIDRAIKELWKAYGNEKDPKLQRAFLDSITDAYLKQAAIDGDALAIKSALEKISRVRRAIKLAEEGAELEEKKQEAA